MRVYETLRTWGGRFIFLDKHEARFGRSLKDLVAPYVGRKDVRLKIVEGGEVTVEELSEWNGSFIYDKIWTFDFVELERDKPEIKNADTSKKDAARAESGCDEVLLVNRAGEITEGSITNVFFIKNGMLITPATGILKGVMRGVILEAAEQLGVPVIERAVMRSEFANYDCVFLCNSIRGIIQIGNLHPLMLKLAEKIKQNYWNS